VHSSAQTYSVQPFQGLIHPLSAHAFSISSMIQQGTEDTAMCVLLLSWPPTVRLICSISLIPAETDAPRLLRVRRSIKFNAFTTTADGFITAARALTTMAEVRAHLNFRPQVSHHSHLISCRSHLCSMSTGQRTAVNGVRCWHLLLWPRAQLAAPATFTALLVEQQEGMYAARI
jgi:hypothetical protein